MSQDAIHVVITAGFIGLMFAWVPIVGVLCPSVWRTSEGMSSPREEQLASRQRPTSVASLSSPRYADQSRDFLEALSTRGERESSRSQAVSPRVPPSSCA